ncbi:Uncharacterized protein RDABS01_010411 [Bienertia sinuspersici]
MAATTSTPFKSISTLHTLSSPSQPSLPKILATLKPQSPTSKLTISTHLRRKSGCKAAEVSVAEEESPASDGKKWVPVVPLSALPRGERRVIIQDGETILLLWYKDEVFAIENRSPAEGAYSEGLLNAKLTQFLLWSREQLWSHGNGYDTLIADLVMVVAMQIYFQDGVGLELSDGCIICPTTDSTFDLRTGEIKEWYPNNPVLRVLTPALRGLFVYSVKLDDQNIYISMGDISNTDGSAEILFSGKAQPGVTATDVNVEEVRMVVDESSGGFGFTPKNEIINGKAAVIGFLLLLDFELLTGKGLLKGTGFLDFLYAVTDAFK